MAFRWAKREEVQAVGDTARISLPRKHRPDYQIILYMGILMLIGLIIIYAIGPQRATVLNSLSGEDIFSDSYFFVKQLTSLFLAIVVFTVAALTPITFIKKHVYKLLLLGFAACVVLMIFGNLVHVDAIVQCSLGACRWFQLGAFGTFQPAELLKLGVLLFLAVFLGVRAKQGKINDVGMTIVPTLIITGLALFLIVFVQKDMGTGIAVGAIVASMLTVGGISKKLGLGLLIITAIMSVLMVVSAPHRMERFATFLGGDTSSTSGDAYHITNSLIAIGSGGFFGVGIGESVQATGYLPEAINDSVFAILGETFGFVGLVIILGLFSALLFRLLKISDHLSDPILKLIVAGAVGWLGAHVILNVAAMTGVFPLTGITLPLLSFGGTSIMFIAAILGLSFQLSRYTSHRSNKEENKVESTYSRRGVGRSRYASRRSS